MEIDWNVVTLVTMVFTNVGTLIGIYVAIRNGLEKEIAIRDAKLERELELKDERLEREIEVRDKRHEDTIRSYWRRYIEKPFESMKLWVEKLITYV
jgi:hypothetical protein